MLNGQPTVTWLPRLTMDVENLSEAVVGLDADTGQSGFQPASFSPHCHFLRHGGCTL